MEKTNTPILSFGSATYAAKRAADIVAVLQNKEQLDDQELAHKLSETLKSYDESGTIDPADLRALQVVSGKLYRIFGLSDTNKVAMLLNEILQEYAKVPYLSAHNNTQWHIHVDGSDHAPWAEWFAASSALALAMLLAEKQRNPGGLCASPTCDKPFIDFGKGGGRSYCSPKCATRERVSAFRKKKR